MIARPMATVTSARIFGPARRARTLLNLTALSLALVASAALAAGPFDGQWKGGARGRSNSLSDKCSTNLDITVTITDGVVTGQAVGLASHPISGKVAPNGSFTGTMSGGSFTGTFSGSSFTGEFTTGAAACPTRAAQLQRG